MVVVTIEIWPGGDESKKRHLGTAMISNDCTGNKRIGNYKVRLSKWGRPKEVWRQGRISGFPRERLGPWDLLFRSLAALIGNRNVAPEWKRETKDQQKEA